MDREISPSRLAEILTNLSREIREPLDSLQADLGVFISGIDVSNLDSESTLARTMITLCDDIRRLTGECLEGQAELEPA